MTESNPLLFLATENPIKGSFRLERPAPGVVAATTAGDGTPTNHKLTANEDSLAVVALESSTTALIADAHFGPTSGEIAARAFARIMLRNPARGPDGLRELLIDLDRVIRAERPADDSSETTAVAVSFTPRGIAWANVGDSVVFLAVPGRSIERLTPPGIDFLGGSVPYAAARDVGNLAMPFVECGSIAMPPGAVALMASDGIERAYSGMSEARLCEILMGSEPLDTRVARLMSEAGSADHGGGRDNLTVVAMTSVE